MNTTATRFLRTVLASAVLATAACAGNDTGVADHITAGKPGRPTTDTTAAAASPAGTPDRSALAPGAPTIEGSGDAPSAAAGATPTTATRTSPASRAVYAPPPGRYVYDTVGETQTTGITSSREPVPPTSVDEVRVSDEPTAMRMVVVTRYEGDDATQEVVIAVTDTEARLVRLSYRPDDTGLAYNINPEPPALLARLPYTDGDRWEIAWDDPTSGISGVGTGTVERHETVTTPAGTFDTAVVTVTQRLRGTVTGTLTATTWVDTDTGIQARQHVITDLQTATGASRTDTTRTLRERPA